MECKNITLVTGFKSPNDILFKKDLKKWQQNMDVILTVDFAEESSHHKVGMVTKYIPELQFDHVEEVVAIIVGPPLMMKFSAFGLLEVGFLEENIWVSQERKMCCGIGKCGHCKIDDVYVCLDGPVFNYTKGRHLLD